MTPGHAQDLTDDPVWVVGNNLIDFRAGNGNFQVDPLPICNDPAVPNAFEYQGQTAQYAQNIQCDENGDPLFWVVDGNVYNRQGLLIADNIDGVNGEPCRTCNYKGSTQVAIIPVVGSCTRFYIVSSFVNDGGPWPSHMRVGVLDLTLANNWPAYSALPFVVRGRYMTIDDGLYTDFPQLHPDESNVGFQYAGGTDGSTALHDATFSNGIDLDVARFDAVQLAPGFGYLLTWSTCLKFRFILFNATGATMVLDQSKNLPGPDQEFFDWETSFRGEVESIVDGDRLKVAYGDHRTLFGAHQYYLKYWEFDISGLDDPVPSMEIIHVPGLLPRLYDCGAYGISEYQYDRDGELINYPRLGGIEFAPGGDLVYLTKSTSLYDEGQWGLPRSNMWYIDLAATDPGDIHNAVVLGPLSESIKLIDTQMEYVRWPSGQDAMVVIGREPEEGLHWFGLLFDPAHPEDSFWEPIYELVENVALREDANSDVDYRLLNNRIDGNTHRQFLAQPVCCDELALARDQSRTIQAGTYDWTVQDNPFACTGGLGTGTVYIATQLRIASGAHVEATGITFRFGPDASLVIDPGGTFETHDCLLTSACPDRRWAGIDVRGSATSNQGVLYYPTTQARLILRNSVVENARIGAKAGDTGFFTLTSSQPGGVINGYSSTFKNCVRGVKFAPYQNYGTTTTQPRRNRSSFSQCTFTVDETYIDDLDFRAHADLWKVDGIKFNGCVFNNLRTDIEESHKLGMGISSLDANYTVQRYCPFFECGPGAPRSSFSGLDHGIHARNSGKARAFTVEYADFTNNICGVLTDGVVGARIVHNEFVLGERAGVALTGQMDLSFANQHRGIYAFSSFGFAIDDNHLVEDAEATNSTEGIVIGYSRGHNDFVFRNSCEGIDDAYVGEGICADPQQKPIVGLQFICNENQNNGYNIWNRKIDNPELQGEWADHTMRTVQGGINRPAGNTFDRDDVNLPTESDLHSNTNLNAVVYKFWGVNTEADPLDIDGAYFVDNPSLSLPAGNCANKYITGFNGDDDGMILFLNAEKLIYGNTRYQYDQLIDGGSTDEVVLEIMSSWPNEAWALRSYLLSRSPYLSAVALQEMVARNSMPQAMQTEVMIANPDATRRDGFIRWVRDNAPVPFPEYMLAQVEASWDDRTYRTTLEEQMGEHHANMTQAANALLQYYGKDTVGEPLDSLRWVWQQVRTPAARYAEALTYMAAGDYGTAAEVVERIPLEHDLKTPEMAERQRMLDIIGLMRNVKDDGRTDAELTTTEQDDLESLIALAHDRPAVWAQNLLCYAYDRCVSWPTGGDGTDWRVMQVEDEPAAFDDGPTMILAPNPATTWCAIGYDLKATATGVSVELMDVAGRSLARIVLNTSRGQAVLDTRNLAVGNYTVRLQNNGAVLGSKQLSVKD